MLAEQTTMRQVREIMRLHEAGVSTRQTDIRHRRHAEPDRAAIHRELRRKHVTLTILWDEYIACHPGAIRTLTGIPVFASSAGPGRAVCRSQCGKRIGPERGCSSTIPGTRSRS